VILNVLVYFQGSEIKKYGYQKLIKFFVLVLLCVLVLFYVLKVHYFQFKDVFINFLWKLKKT